MPGGLPARRLLTTADAGDFSYRTRVRNRARAVQPYHDELAGARLLTSHDVIVSTIATTTIPAGLTVRAGLDSGTYPEGIKVSDEQMAALPTARHDWHGD